MIEATSHDDWSFKRGYRKALKDMKEKMKTLKNGSIDIAQFEKFLDDQEIFATTSDFTQFITKGTPD